MVIEETNNQPPKSRHTLSSTHSVHWLACAWFASAVHESSSLQRIVAAQNRSSVPSFDRHETGKRICLVMLEPHIEVGFAWTLLGTDGKRSCRRR
jgi:hypothetical protein